MGTVFLHVTLPGQKTKFSFILITADRKLLGASVQTCALPFLASAAASCTFSRMPPGFIVVHIVRGQRRSLTMNSVTKGEDGVTFRNTTAFVSSSKRPPKRQRFGACCISTLLFVGHVSGSSSLATSRYGMK